MPPVVARTPPRPEKALSASSLAGSCSTRRAGVMTTMTTMSEGEMPSLAAMADAMAARTEGSLADATAAAGTVAEMVMVTVVPVSPPAGALGRSDWLGRLAAALYDAASESDSEGEKGGEELSVGTGSSDVGGRECVPLRE